MIKKTVLLFLVVFTAVLASASENGQNQRPVELSVYLYDECGGCGANNPGCGECRLIDRYHGIIKKQFGDRLYEGGIEYRMFNCRLDVNDLRRVEKSALFGVPGRLRNARPITFIGSDGDGVYLPGEETLNYAGEALDRYMAGEDVEIIQRDILSIVNGS